MGCQASDPQLFHNGVDAPGSLQVLDKAKNYQEQEIAVAKLEGDRRAGFDWAFFWSHLGEGNRIQKLSPAQQRRVFVLSSNSCSARDFDEFAKMALKTRKGFEFVVGAERKCSQPLSEEVFTNYVNLFAQKAWSAPAAETNIAGLRGKRLGGSDEDAKLMAELLISQYDLSAPDQRLRILQRLTINQWQGLIERLLTGSEGHKAAQLVQINQREFGGIRFLDSMVLSWITNPVAFRHVLDKNDLMDVVHILTSDTDLSVSSRRIRPKEWQQTYDLIADRFETYAQRKLNSAEGFQIAIRVLRTLESLPRIAAQPIPFSDQLMWTERMLRSLEQAVRDHEEAALWFRQADTDLIVLWLKRRLNQAWSFADDEDVDRMTAASPLSRALLLKLKLRNMPTPLVFQTSLHAYCSWLESQGVAPRKISGAKFDWKETERPGCIELTENKTPSDTVDHSIAGHVQMSFDSILLTHGWNLKLKASDFDGSFIDLSTTLKHPDLPFEPTSTEDDAVTFPIMMGIRVDKDPPRVLNGVGTYYFIYHYTWRKAQPGRPAVARPQRGYPGATFTLQVQNVNEAHWPQWISIGGSGQKGAPPRLGGRESRSSVAWTPLALGLNRAVGFGDDPVTKPFAIANISLGILEQLFRYGATDDQGKLQLFIEPKRVQMNSTEDQNAKALRACSQEACWHNLTLNAAREIWARFIQSCPLNENRIGVCSEEVRNMVFDRLDSNYFVEPKGALGPENPNGRPGPAGRFDVTEAR